MDHIAGMQVVETLNDVRYLRRGQDFSEGRTKKTHKREPVCTGAVCDVFQDVTTWHPIRKEFKSFSGCAQKGDYVLMCQILPHFGYPMEDLRGF